MSPKPLGRAPSKPIHSTQMKRKSSLVETQKKEKGRSRNACDRCKQKKVKCDGEGQRVCSICRAGDHQCTYAQRPHEDKRQYRKGYVEMVEETNNYYKTGLHECYRVFEKSTLFSGLRAKYASGGEPTVQEIITALGVPATGKAHEGGFASINAYLEQENRPMMERIGEWDREVVPGGGIQVPSPDLSSDDEMDDEPIGTSPETFAPVPVLQYPRVPERRPLNPSQAAQLRAHQPADPNARAFAAPAGLAAPGPHLNHIATAVNLPGAHNPLTSSYLAQLNGLHTSSGGSSHGGSPLPPSTPESVAHSQFSDTISPAGLALPASRTSFDWSNVNNLNNMPMALAFDPMAADGTVRLSDVEFSNDDILDWSPFTQPTAGRNPFMAIS